MKAIFLTGGLFPSIYFTQAKQHRKQLDSGGRLLIITPILKSIRKFNEGEIMDSNTNGSQDGEIRDGKFFAAIGYLSLLCFVPLLLKKGNKFAQFHGKQALVLFILEMAACILKAVPALGDLVFTVAFVVFGIFSLIGITKVLMGEYWEMPVIYEIANKISI